MTFSPTSRQVVLHELFDDSSEPTNDEVKDYALKIGVDIENESHLLPLARDCLMQPLPSDWKPCCDSDLPDQIYYFNFKTNRAQWVHPLEEVHQALISRVRSEGTSSTEPFEEDSRTTVKEDLKSFEEAVQSEFIESEMIPKPRLLEPLGLNRGVPRKPPATLGPLKMATPASPKEYRNDLKKVSFNECEVKKRPNSSDIRNRRNIEPVELRHLSKQEIMTPRTQWRDEGYFTESSQTQPTGPLTLSGGGAVFLKKANMKIDPSKSIVLNEVLEEKDLKMLDPVDDDEKKSVRFKLEKELKVNFETPKNLEAEDSTSRKLEDTNPKQIELDFEELIIDLNEMHVPKDRPKTVISRDSPWLKQAPFDKSSRSYKKSINIVLNGKSPLDSSQDEKKSDNLIDLTEADSLSTVDSKDSEVVVNTKMTAVLPELDELFYINKSKSPIAIENSDLFRSNTLKKVKNSNVIVDEFSKVSENIECNKRPELDNADYNLERTKQQLDAAKADKLKALEGDFNNWVKNTEKLFREKEKLSYNNMKEQYEDWKKNEENGMIKEMGERCAEEMQGKVKALKNELLKEEQEAIEELKSALALQTRERLRALREEIESQEEKELAVLRKSLEESLAARKEELYRKHQDEMSRLERSLESILAEQRSQRQQELEKAREDEAALAAMRAQLKDALLEQKTILQQEHEMALQKLKQQHEVEVFQVVSSKPIDMSPRLSVPPSFDDKKSQNSSKDSSDPRVYEKLRCEKRLLEDKYKSLKEKYVRLKTEVKTSIDKKTKKKELAVQSASETEKSNSFKVLKAECDSPNVRKKDVSDKKIKLKKQLNHLDNVNHNVSTDEEELANSKNGRGELPSGGSRGAGRVTADGSSGEEVQDDARLSMSRKRRQLFSKLKAASTSRLHSGYRQEKDDVMSPVENLRRQLKKLEELEDQFPVTTHTDTYLRYPFSDTPAPHFASSELEFFKHRIHLERDSVRRAKEFLKTQKKCYENRQRELQHRLQDGGPSSKSIVEQIHQEERELTEMEISVHRTRALLGEKIIRLRHLEHSLRRMAPERKSHTSAHRSVSREDGTLSDLSSHSDSSGFSSTHQTSELLGPRPSLEKNRRHLQSSMQESSEIINSLENLNSEIRGIWEVLKQSTGPGAIQLPPPPLAWPAVRTNPTAGLVCPRPLTQQMMTQVSGVGHVTTVVDSSLVDRTRSLRDWLKSARRSPNPGDSTVSHQVTL